MRDPERVYLAVLSDFNTVCGTSPSGQVTRIGLLHEGT